METLSFDYRPKIGTGLIILLFGAVFGAGMVWLAIGNDKGLDVFGVVLPVAVATVFYVIMGLFFALGIPIGVNLIRDSFGEPAQVVLSDTAITAPVSDRTRKHG